jgi:hypothetical protein
LISDCPRCNVATGKPGIGLGAGHIRLGLHDLLVEIGRLDLGQNLTGLDRRSHVGGPRFDVAADACVELGLRQRFQAAGKIDDGRSVVEIGGLDRYDRHRLGFGKPAQPRVGRLPCRDAEEHDGGGNGSHRRGDDAQPARGYGRSGEIRRHEAPQWQRQVSCCPGDGAAG